MPALVPDRAALLPLLPQDKVGAVLAIDPITLGLSGAGVFAVKTSRGAYVLRVQGRRFDDQFFTQQLLVLRRAAAAGVAPAIAHVDEAARAMVLVRAPGEPIASALVDPAKRGPVLAAVVDRLRALHALDPSDIAERDPMAYTRAAFQAARERSGFPPWAATLAPRLDAMAAILARDPRRVVSHNDVNPVNILWDGTRAWLVDWEVAGLAHPHFDLATLALFLRLAEEGALELIARHDGAPPDGRSRATFRVLRQLVGMLCGLTFLSLVDDLNVRSAPTAAEAPSLEECYRAMRTGELDLRSARGQASMGLALLALGITGQA